MRHTRLISAAAGALFLAGALVGCSEAEDAAKDAGDKAKDKASAAASDGVEKGKAKASAAASDGVEKGKAKASDKASELLSDATDGTGAGKAAGKGAGATDGTGEGAGEGAGAGTGAGTGDVTVDLGDYSDDAGAKTVGEFFSARQAAVVANDGDLDALEAITTAGRFQAVSAFVSKYGGKASPLKVTVVGADATSVDVCVGPNGDRPRTFDIEDGKVAGNGTADHTC